MKSIAEKVKHTIVIEVRKNSDDKNLAEFIQILSQLEKLGYSKKPQFSLPLIDTIGKTIYANLNKH